MSLLRELAGHIDYVRILKQAEEARPALPVWDSKVDNTDEWKEKSAMQAGFDLCLSFFKPH